MKTLILFSLIAILASCGGVNQWNHSKLKKVRVGGEEKKTEQDQAKTFTKQVEYEIESEEIREPVDEIKVESTRGEVESENKLPSTKTEIAALTKMKLVSFKKKVDSLPKGKQIRGLQSHAYLSKSQSSDSRGVDWVYVGQIALIALGAVLLLLGWIFFPNLTAFVVALAQVVLLIIIIVMVCAAVGWFFSMVFS